MGKLKSVFIAIVLALFVREFCYSPVPVTQHIYPGWGFIATVDKSRLKLSLLHQLTKHLQHNHTLGLGLKAKTEVHIAVTDGEIRMDWPKLGRLEVITSKIKNDGVSCYNVSWESISEVFKPMDCFSLGEAHWYGGAEMLEQRWPINSQRSRMQPYLTGDYLSPYYRKTPEYGRYGSVLEPYWIASSGIGIHVSENVTLHSSFNADGDGQLCLKADQKGYSNADPDESTHSRLIYTVCQAEDLLKVHRYMAQQFLPRPRAIPDQRMIRAPIWSTWARYKVNVTQASVLEYAKEILKYGFPNSQMEIDDMYTTHYGDFDFNPKKFPNASQMIAQLHSLGFRVTTWMTPFANIESRAFLEGAEKSFWIKTAAPKSVTSLTRWWQGTAGVLDVANDKAVDWFSRRLKDFQHKFGIDSFKFDAGEVDFLPRDLSAPSWLINSNHLTDLYVRMTERFGGMVEVRSAYRSQDVPVFFRMLDKDSHWSYENGLRSVIPTALFMGIIGYPFILPDMIGGNGYGDNEPLRTTSIPDRELFVRWLELSAFLPSMQFSIVPWQYDDEVVKIAGKFVRLHESFVAPEIIKAAEHTLKTGNR